MYHLEESAVIVDEEGIAVDISVEVLSGKNHGE